jgi:O-antigen/teichoic acid export membrane protein
MFSIIWMLFMPLLMLCGIAGGIFLMVTGIIHRKFLAILMGIICCSFVIMPFIFLNKGYKRRERSSHSNSSILDTLLSCWLIRRNE